MDKLSTEELLDLRKLLYKAWLLAPVHDDNLYSLVMDETDAVLKARGSWVDYEADYEYATADTVS